MPFSMDPQPLGQIRKSTVEGLLTGLAAAAPTATPAEPALLDLSEVRHLERGAGAVLCNALIGSLGDCPLRVRLPDVDAADWLGATGLAFAFANREAITTYAGPHADLDLTAWMRQWIPGREVFGETEATPTLFGPDEAGETTVEPDLEATTYGAFIDPHLTTDPVQSDHPVNTIVWPWLSRLLPQARLELAHRDSRQDFVAEVGQLVSEMVQNITQHAAGSQRGVRSMVHVSLTRGGGTASFDRLHLSVHDTGPGIPATARPKVEAESRPHLSDDQLVFMLFEGSLRPWGRSRGLGLPKMAEICERRKGSLFAATQTTRFRIRSRPPYRLVGHSDFRINGTVLSVMLPLP